MNVVDLAKNLATVIGTASVLGYITGYLVMRARAAALGTDPAFVLVDEVYVFAGFRFLLLTTVLLLLAAPIVALLRWLALTLRPTWSDTPAMVDWILLGLLLIAVFWVLQRTLSANGVLLLAADEVTSWHRMVLGYAPASRVGLTMLTLVLFCLSVVWLRARSGGAMIGFEWVLAALLAIQSFLLPIQHGSYFAERRVRVLDALPASVTGVVLPAGVIDGNGDRVTILANGRSGGYALATLKRDDLNGIPVRSTMLLKKFMTKLEDGSAGGLRKDEEMTTKDDAALEERPSFFAALLERLNVTLEQIGSLGSSGVEAGELWVVDLDGENAGTPRRVGKYSSLAWPVAAGERTFALEQGRLVELTESGAEQRGAAETFWLKLVGATDDGAVLGITLSNEGNLERSVLSAEGELTVDPTKHEQQIGFLMQESRSYTGGRSLRVDRPEDGRGFDVFYHTSAGKQNVSRCGGDMCGHPSLAADGRSILFVRESRY